MLSGQGADIDTTTASGKLVFGIFAALAGYKLANDGHDTRAIQQYLGHKNIQHTVYRSG